MREFLSLSFPGGALTMALGRIHGAQSQELRGGGGEGISTVRADAAPSVLSTHTPPILLQF